MNPKWPIPRHIIIKMAKFKDKERILKAEREKEELTYKETPIKLAADFQQKNCNKEKMARNIPKRKDTKP